MARRSKNKPLVTQFFNRDRLAFIALAKIGHVSYEHLKLCGLADRRIQNLMKDGHLKKVVYERKGKIEECYKLTKQGRETARHFWNLDRAYHAQSPCHDIALANKYFSLPEHLRENWLSENQVRDLFHEKLNELRDQGKETEAGMYEDMLAEGRISMPDAVYRDEGGKEIGFEVLTKNYNEAERESKENLIGLMEYQYETTRI